MLKALTPSHDPSETARDNREKLRQALARLQELGLAWALESKVPNPGDWENRAETYLEFLGTKIKISVLTSIWSEHEIWALLQGLPSDEASAGFWTAVQHASGFDDLATELQLSPEAVNGAVDRLAIVREAARRRNRVVEVCGREFDNTDDNMQGLWPHISQAIPETSLGDLPAIDLDIVADLEGRRSAQEAKEGCRPPGPEAA